MESPSRIPTVTHFSTSYSIMHPIAIDLYIVLYDIFFPAFGSVLLPVISYIFTTENSL